MLLKAGHQWVSSPLGYNILLSLLNQVSPSVEKYIQVTELLKEKKIGFIKTRLFVSTSCNLRDHIKLMNISDIQVTNFSEADNAFKIWVNKYGSIIKDNNISKDINSRTEFVLANIASFQSTWPSCEGSGPIMKVYNSFNYTDDVKYEPRLLELPLEGEIKMVVLVPNEVDALQCLLKTLTRQGFEETIKSIQPLFTAASVLDAPHIDISSRVEHLEKIYNVGNCSTMQYGSLLVNKTGMTITVMTCCIQSPLNITTAEEHCPKYDKPFYLAVVYNNIPLFLGQFVK